MAKLRTPSFDETGTITSKSFDGWRVPDITDWTRSLFLGRLRDGFAGWHDRPELLVADRYTTMEPIVRAAFAQAVAALIGEVRNHGPEWPPNRACRLLLFVYPPLTDPLNDQIRLEATRDVRAIFEDASQPGIVRLDAIRSLVALRYEGTSDFWKGAFRVLAEVGSDATTIVFQALMRSWPSIAFEWLSDFGWSRRAEVALFTALPLTPTALHRDTAAALAKYIARFPESKPSIVPLARAIHLDLPVQSTLDWAHLVPDYVQHGTIEGTPVDGLPKTAFRNLAAASPTPNEELSQLEACIRTALRLAIQAGRPEWARIFRAPDQEVCARLAGLAVSFVSEQALELLSDLIRDWRHDHGMLMEPEHLVVAAMLHSARLPASSKATALARGLREPTIHIVRHAAHKAALYEALTEAEPLVLAIQNEDHRRSVGRIKTAVETALTVRSAEELLAWVGF